jgi:phosphoglycerol transferase MdoB-like AlkP superfamily enzyme
MKKQLKFFFALFLFWILFSVVTRAMFLTYNLNLSRSVPFHDIMLVFFYGLRFDASIAAYLLVIPCLITIFSYLFSGNFYTVFIKWYTIIFLLLFSLITIIDMELYSFWGFRLDSTPLLYIKSPKEALASSPVGLIVRQVIIGFMLFILFYWIYSKFIHPIVQQFWKAEMAHLFLFIFFTSALIIPIRGGLGIAPLNPGMAYFHKNAFANHATLNVFWNLGYSFEKSQDLKDSRYFFDKDTSEKYFSELYPHHASYHNVLNTAKPNIILIIVESLTGKVIKEISGREGITPNFSRYIKEGMFFRNFYASGDRTDKAFVAILSGFPAQPKTSLIKYPSKIQHLPFLPADLKHAGFHSIFYYGGNIDFASMRSYLNYCKYDRIITEDDFKATELNSKWGAHDHVVLTRMLNELDTVQTPFFTTLLTLSSHPPFDVPMELAIKGNDDESKFLNSLVYTDRCIGNFLDQAKQKKWWSNTLLIVLADHGDLKPNNSPNNSPKKYTIPMLWLGGALNVKDTVISAYSSQTDLCSTLLTQLNMDSQFYKFSNNILSEKKYSFAFYVFNNGFGFLADSTQNIFDLTSQKSLIGDTNSINYKYCKAYFDILRYEFNKN